MFHAPIAALPQQPGWCACSDLSSIPLKSGHSVVQRSSSEEEAGSQDRDKAAEWGVRLLYTGEV